MSGLILVVIGALLCFAGAWSLRLAVTAAGFGAGWLIGDAFDASTTTTLLLGLSVAVIALLVTLLATSVLLWVIGATVGAVIAARLLRVLEGGEASVLLGVLFIPAMAFASGFLAHRFKRRFVIWATAAGGAALVLSGLGRLAPDALGDLRTPESTTGQVVGFGLWVALAVTGGLVQRALLRGRD
jgi:hypothetical protein